jgi:hypothetical protein
VLIVNESHTETESIDNFRRGLAQDGGWSLPDLQRFWMKLGVCGAVNSDGGVETQRTFLLPNGTYDLLTPQMNAPAKHITLMKDFSNAPDGGTLMTFYISGRR